MENNIDKELLNAEGKRLLQKTKLEYSKNIIDILKNNPRLFNEILDNMYISKEELLGHLSGEIDGNIVIYDQALVLARKFTNNINNKKNT